MDEDEWDSLDKQDDKDETGHSDGVLVIRTWHEQGHPQKFRSRVTYGYSSEIKHVVATAGPAEVLQVVTRWIAAQTGFSDRN